MPDDQHRFEASEVDQAFEAVLGVLRQHAMHAVHLSDSEAICGHFGPSLKVVLDGFRTGIGDHQFHAAQASAPLVCG